MVGEKYVGRHSVGQQPQAARQVRHGAWVSKKRTRSGGPQLLPTAAALTVAGFLASGAAAGMHLSSAEASEDPSLRVDVDASTVPPLDEATKAKGQVYASDNATGAGINAAPAAGLRGAVAVESADANTTDVWLNTRLATGSLTARSAVLPVGTQVLVTNPETGRSVVVQITGSAVESLELSRAAFDVIAPADVRYIATVHVQVLPEGSYSDAT